MANINQVLEELARQNQQMGVTMGHLDTFMAQLVENENARIRADVRGGVDISYSVGLGVTSPDNQTVGQVIAHIKPETGMVYGVVTFNNDSTTRYLRFYEGPSVPVVGSTPMKFPIGLPTGSGAVFFGGIGIPFKSGIWIAATAGPTDSTADCASPTANKVLVVAFYK